MAAFFIFSFSINLNVALQVYAKQQINKKFITEIVISANKIFALLEKNYLQ